MSSRKSRKTADPNAEALVKAGVAVWTTLPPAGRLAALVVLAVGGLLWWATHRPPVPPGDAPPDPAWAAVPPTDADGNARYLFCWWNVENLFDDKDDRRREVDEEYDNPFAHDAHMRDLKYDHIATTLLRMNGGRGPDVIACCELESVRAAEILRGVLNARIPDPKQKYANVAMKDLDAGRHIAPGVITRLPVDFARTKLLGRGLRVLETHLRVANQDLTVLATHWTSQVSQRGGGADTASGRGKYAALCYDTFAAYAKDNPAVDFLVCGDFNDTPGSESVVDVLGATGDRKAVAPRAVRPQLLDLLAGKPPEKYGTIYYNGKPLIYDQICVSPGMLDDRGWGCDPDSVKVMTDGLIRPGSTRRQPWRFGNPEPPMKDADRGFSDHFPVTVELTLRPPAAAAQP